MFTMMTFVLSIGKQPAIGCQHMPHSFCKASLLTEGDITVPFRTATETRTSRGKFHSSCATSNSIQSCAIEEMVNNQGESGTMPQHFK